jgi:hypothetical protein
MPKGEIVGKCLTGRHMLVIDGKYSSEDGMSTRRSIRSILGRRCRASSISSEEIVQRIVGRFNRQSELVIDGRIRVCIDGTLNIRSPEVPKCEIPKQTRQLRTHGTTRQ